MSATRSCKSSSGTTCSVTCSEGTLTLVCNKNKKKCSGSCSKAKNQKSAAFNLIKDVYIATGGRVAVPEIHKKLKDAPMKLEGAKFELIFSGDLNVKVIIATDFHQFYKPDWKRALDQEARRFEALIRMRPIFPH